MKKRLCIKFKDGTHANIEADYITHSENGFIVAFKDNALIGAFNLLEIIGLYISESKEKNP